MPFLSLALLFFVVALAYASVGFGGGSTYNALLVLWGVDYQVIPVIALTCNIIVVSGGVYHFHRAGVPPTWELLPFILLSVPCAWLGGRLPVSELVFTGMLGAVLLLAGLQTLRGSLGQQRGVTGLQVNYWLLGVPAGAAIGLVSGIVGIGGGIFLAPLLYLTGRQEPRRVAAMASGFILVNSIAGLTGQLMKQRSFSALDAWTDAWPLMLAVIIGGQAGSRLGVRVLPETWVQRLTAGLIIYVALRLLLQWYALMEAN